MRNHSQRLGKYWMILLLVFSASVFATTITAGTWQLDTDLNDTAAQAMLGTLAFSPQANISANAWLVSSSIYQLSDGTGAIGSSVLLDPNCPSQAGPACASSSDLYLQADKRLLKVGHLSFHSNSMFALPSSASSGSFNYPTSSSNSSALASSPDIPLSISQDWLWALAAVLTLGLTAAFMIRNKD